MVRSGHSTSQIGNDVLNAQLAHREPGLVDAGRLGPRPQHIGLGGNIFGGGDASCLLEETSMSRQSMSHHKRMTPTIHPMGDETGSFRMRLGERGPTMGPSP